MHVGVITTSYPRDEGDPAGSFVAGHVAWLRRQGHTVDVVCAGAATRPHQWVQPGVNVTAIAAPPGLFYEGGAPDLLARQRAAWPGALGFAARLVTALAGAAARWDVAVAHWLLPCAAAAALCPVRLRLVAVAHSGDVALACRLGLAAPLAALLRARRAELRFVSEALRERMCRHAGAAALRRYLRVCSEVTPMGIDMARFQAVAAGRSAQPGRELRVLFLGRLVPIKGAHIAVAAAPLLAPLARALGRPIRMILAGDGPERGALMRQAAALVGPGPVAVELCGEVRGAARDALLGTADAVVIPSIAVEGDRTEGMPVTVLEAMASEVPVVAARTGGLAELPDHTVRLFAPGEPASLAAALAGLLGNAEARRTQVQAARVFASGFDWEHVGPKLLPCS